MAQGNYTSFKAKHVKCIKFGYTAWPTTAMSSTTQALDTSFDKYNAAGKKNGLLIDATGAADSLNPTRSWAFAKDFKVSGNERSSGEEALLGADTAGSQNVELTYGNASKSEVECTCVYRNPNVTGIFNDSTKAVLIQLDNAESATTGVVNMAFNNIVMISCSDLTRNADGLMEQKVKFVTRGGFAGAGTTATQVTPAETWVRYKIGLDRAEEIRVA